MKGWHDVTTKGYFAGYPRWAPDGTLYYVVSNGKQSPGLERLTKSGKEQRLSRRNGVAPNVPLRDGSIVYSQLDLTDPYRDRSDLYRRQGRAHDAAHARRATQRGRCARGWRDRRGAVRAGDDDGSRACDPTARRFA